MVAVAARTNGITTLTPRGDTALENCKERIADRLLGIALQFENPLRDACTHHLGTNGKMLRGQLAVRAALADGADTNQAIEWGVAVELLHNATLVHDDICDMDETRRGRASVSHLFGSQVALCLGDALISESYAAARRYTRRSETLDALSLTIKELAQGQASEFACNHYPSVERCFAIAIRKTGPLFSLPVCGALRTYDSSSVAGSTKKYLNACAIAFQAINDLANFDRRVSSANPSSDFSRMRPNIAISLFADSLDTATRRDFDALYRSLAQPRHEATCSQKLMEQFWITFSGSVALRSALSLTKLEVETADRLFEQLEKKTAEVVSPLHAWLLATSEKTCSLH